MNEASSEARKTAPRAISSARASRPIGCLGPHTRSASSTLPKRAAMRAVATPPGDRVLTRIPSFT